MDESSRNSRPGGRRAAWAAGAIGIALMLGSCVTDKVSEVTSSVSDVFATADPQAPLHIPMFVVSTRRGKGQDSNELADAARESLQTITVPPGHRPGEIERASFGKDNPQYHFAVAAFRPLDASEFKAELASHLSGRIGSNRDVLLYVHGFNTSYDEARFRLAQVVADGRFGGVPVLFTWPASGSLFDYEAAKESASASRDALAQTLVELSDLPDVGKIHILAHSMGSWLTMEALRQDAIAGRPDLNGKLGNVMLAAPDIDVNVFRNQLQKISPSHVSVLVSSSDRALFLSRRLAGDRPRLGSMNPRNPADRAMLDRLGVKVFDVSDESVGMVGHATFGDAPDVVRQIGATIGAKRLQDENVTSVLGDRPVSEKVMTQPLPPMTGNAMPPPIAPSASKVPSAAAAIPSAVPPVGTPPASH